MVGEPEMYTPLGTRIVSLLYGETFMTVQIFPSLRDVGRTKGLCGTLTDDCKDDFLKSDGTTFTNGDTARECNTLGLTDYKFRPDEFSYSWRADEGNNLFKDEPTFDGNHWAANKQICICRKDNSVVDGDEYIDCSSSSVVTCNREEEVKTPQTCSSLFQRTWSAPFIQKSRTKRSPYKTSRDLGKSIVWTEAEAIEQCRLFMDKSESFKMCKEIPNVDPTIAINTCVLDILLTNSTQWMINAREGIKGKCLAEVRVNATLQNETESGGASIAEIVKNASCINDCLERGRCEYGSCVCDDGYGGGDCGIVLSIPPIIYGMIDSGLCDISLVPCTEANLEGDGFTSEGNPNCRIKKFQVIVFYLKASLQIHFQKQTFCCFNIICLL
ncbi:uncharacterized protein LOC133195010 [Saccostrea echinata]|uniref:uncharacterized protein LOC133195010 n=1 Tax=Saccostrea echinata TaxID=191078 RepID=UPI002A819926|nr:uncharacterized protein LOC133195010 [Saccostrea echinata]